MATTTCDAPKPNAPPRRWIAFVAGMAMACLLIFGIALIAAPRSSVMLEDPLTGRRKHESTWLHMPISTTIEENEVSAWADANGAKDIYPARFGWTPITSVTRDWFYGGCIACGGGRDIPGRIFRGEISVDGLTKEEILRNYQTDSIAEYQQHQSTFATQQAWKAKGKR